MGAPFLAASASECGLSETRYPLLRVRTRPKNSWTDPAVCAKGNRFSLACSPPMPHSFAISRPRASRSSTSKARQPVQGPRWEGHWTPEGHEVVAERLLGLLSANSVIGVRRKGE